MDKLEQLASKGLFFGFTQSGGLVTVQELLQRKLGREVEMDEALAYVQQAKKRAFIDKVKDLRAKQ